MEFIHPHTFDEAIEKMGVRSPIGSKLNSAEWSGVPVELRQRAFFSSEVENVRFLQRAKDSLGDFLSGARESLQTATGETTALKVGSRAEFVKQLQAFAIAEGLGPLDPDDAGTIKDITSQRRLELIFDTNVRQAQEYGAWKQGLDPDILDAFPASRFIRVSDVSEPRDWHTKFEGGVWLKTDLAAWMRINRDFGTPYGPWGWGCGHDLEDVSREDAEALGLIQPGARMAPPDVTFNDRAQASIKHLDPEFRDVLRERLADVAEFDDEEGTIRWKKKREGGQP